ncbi:Hypothetical protein, putative [Bodo saltans]|uniref:Uncharacterized protein n=1 Tax=Bodo saltans TaxID=75058 RepID=A0A0S4JNT1_BODSA|nr:Hypothetical protein, putative [Bodo saltans]|eukprot:CUG92298.1 Hypothetical protein, putative [Bodo saltans]
MYQPIRLAGVFQLCAQDCTLESYVFVNTANTSSMYTRGPSLHLPSHETLVDDLHAAEFFLPRKALTPPSPR